MATHAGNKSRRLQPTSLVHGIDRIRNTLRRGATASAATTSRFLMNVNWSSMDQWSLDTGATSPERKIICASRKRLQLAAGESSLSRQRRWTSSSVVSFLSLVGTSEKLTWCLPEEIFRMPPLGRLSSRSRAQAICVDCGSSLVAGDSLFVLESTRRKIGRPGKGISSFAPPANSNKRHRMYCHNPGCADQPCVSVSHHVI